MKQVKYPSEKIQLAIDSLMSRSNEIAFAARGLTRRRINGVPNSIELSKEINSIVSNVDLIRRKVRVVKREFELDKDSHESLEKCISIFLDIVDVCRELRNDVLINKNEIQRISRDENVFIGVPSAQKSFKVLYIPDIFIQEIDGLLTNISTFLHDVDGTSDGAKGYVEFMFPRDVARDLPKLSVRQNVGYEFRSEGGPIKAVPKAGHLPQDHTKAACYAFESIKRNFEVLIDDLDRSSNVDSVTKGQIYCSYENYKNGFDFFSPIKADIDSWSIKQSLGIIRERASDTSLMIVGTILTTQEILFAQYPDWIAFKQRTGLALGQDDTRQKIVGMLDEIIEINSKHKRIIDNSSCDALEKARESAKTITVENTRPILTAKDQSSDFLKEVIRASIELKSDIKEDIKKEIKSTFKSYLKNGVKKLTKYMVGDIEYLGKLMKFFSDEE